MLLALAPAFTQPTFRRFVTPLAAALLTPGRRTAAVQKLPEPVQESLLSALALAA